MDSRDGLEDLIEHLEGTTRLSRAEVERVVEEFLSYFHESLEQFVRRRHAELRAEDQKNAAIYERIAVEVRRRRFAAPTLSQRQIRRLIYG